MKWLLVAVIRYGFVSREISNRQIPFGGNGFEGFETECHYLYKSKFS
jgi:hypothetical protein